MDLDALGLNSTFESTELEHSHQPPVDRLDTSEIEGPEDFTMNMTYWMTADLPLAQIKSRKEANTKRPVIRMDAIQDGSESRHATEVGEPAVVVEDTEQRRSNRSRTASPTRRANGTKNERQHSSAPSERSMENDEKVRSFLSNLPDTEMEGALTGTPLHAPRHSYLQVPRSSPPKARSLQPTVEDYDTPRKPTQETVIRHTSAIIDTSEQDVARNKIAELQHRLEQQESTSRSRITELETILSYTRSELESTRNDNYKHKEKVSSLEKSLEQQRADHEAARAAAEAEVKAREDALETRMHEFGEEMRLQNLNKLETLLEEFERQRKTLEESKRQLTEEVEDKDQRLEEIQAELAQVRQIHERELHDLKETHLHEPGHENEDAAKERLLLTEQLSSVQARAAALQSSLETATSDAKLAREETRKRDEMRSAVEKQAQRHTARIAELEGQLQAAKFEVECSHADVAAKQQLFHTNLDLNSRLRSLQSDLETTRRLLTATTQDNRRIADLEARVIDLQSQLEAARAGGITQGQRHLHAGELENRVKSLETQLQSALADVAAKDQQLQRTAALEGELDSVQSQLELSGTTKATTDGHPTQVAELETRIRSLQTQLRSAQADLKTKDQQMSELVDSQEQAEQRLSTAQGRLQSLETGNTNLRQQLAEAHRDSAKARADAERSEQDLEDANDRLQDARAEADRRVNDIEKKLNKMKELKLEAENKFKELRDQHEDMVEGHEAMMEDVRDKAEDAVRKAGALLEQERSEKRSLIKDLKRAKEETERLRAAALAKSLEEDTDDDTTISSPATETNAKDSEIANLREIIRKQVSETKTLKSELSALRKDNKNLKSTSTSSSQDTIATLEAQISALRSENEALESRLANQAAENAAINQQMDEKLATLLSKLMKEKAKTVVGKRDGQWTESVRELEEEKKLLGKVLMRQWGREEVGIDDEREAKDGKQAYRYKYVKR
jgi:chromosome segregation ATPase